MSGSQVPVSSANAYNGSSNATNTGITSGKESGPAPVTIKLSSGSGRNEQDLPIRNGNMKKKSSKINQWGDRYFVLRNGLLSYYQKKSDLVRLFFLSAVVFSKNC